MSSVGDGSFDGQMQLQLNRREGNSADDVSTPSAHEHVSDLSDEHCHSEELPDDTVARNQLIAVSILCFLFMIGEIVGGLLAHSLAIATDATHMASDLASFLVSLFAIWLAKKPATVRMSFGYYRAEVVGALISVLVIWVVTGILVYLAVHRIIEGEYEIGSISMLITAVVGVAFNIVMGIVLHGGLWKGCRVETSFGHGHSHGGDVVTGHSHGHGHGHSHDREEAYRGASVNACETVHCDSDDDVLSAVDHTLIQHADNVRDDELLICMAGDDSSCDVPALCSSTTLLTTTTDPYLSTTATTVIVGSDHRSHTNINVRAALIHVIGDFIQSIGVLIAAIIIHIKPEYKIADPICTFLFSFLVLCTTINVLRDVLLIMMEGVPRGVDYRAIKDDLQRLEGVKTAHSLNVWALTVGRLAVGVHLAVGPEVRWPDILNRATLLLRTKYKVHQSTIQIEHYQEHVMSSCVRCQNP